VLEGLQESLIAYKEAAKKSQSWCGMI
jgi:hypothetical protein